jgi:O-glycosyl hydrolase
MIPGSETPMFRRPNIGSAVHLVAGSIAIAALLMLPFSPSRADGASQHHTVNLGTTYQTIDNFGASDCWTFQHLDSWSDENKNRVADLLFSQTKGIGLSLWRCNLGGGICNETVTDSWRTIETYEVGEGEYDWTVQPGSRWFLGAAKARGVRQFLAFVNSPPRRMTRNGFTNCTDRLGTTNLNDGYEGQFARYLVDIVRHFRDNPDRRERVFFNYISPVNEPQYEWNGPTWQEGNRAGNDDIKRIIRALYAELRRQHVDSQIIAPESGNIYAMHSRDGSWNSMMGKYGAEYGDYIWRFCMDPEWAEAMGRTICYHDYGSDWPSALIDQRYEIVRERDWLGPGWKIWMTEYCYLEAGRDLSMWLALHVARLIHYDLTIANVSAWQWWTAMAPGDYKDGLLYTNWRNPGDEESIIESKTLWALGNFSRFIRPGWKRVEIAGVEGDPESLLGSAYADLNTGKVAIVYVNRGYGPVNVNIDFTGTISSFYALTPFVTSDTEGDNLKPYPTVAAGGTYTIPPRSVVTLVGRTLTTAVLLKWLYRSLLAVGIAGLAWFAFSFRTLAGKYRARYVAEVAVGRKLRSIRARESVENVSEARETSGPAPAVPNDDELPSVPQPESEDSELADAGFATIEGESLV